MDVVDSENEFEVVEPEDIGTSVTNPKRPAGKISGKRQKAEVSDYSDETEEEELVSYKRRRVTSKTSRPAAKQTGKAAKKKSKKEVDVIEEGEEKDNDVERKGEGISEVEEQTPSKKNIKVKSKVQIPTTKLLKVEKTTKGILKKVEDENVESESETVKQIPPPENIRRKSKRQILGTKGILKTVEDVESESEVEKTPPIKNRITKSKPQTPTEVRGRAVKGKLNKVKEGFDIEEDVSDEEQIPRQKSKRGKSNTLMPVSKGCGKAAKEKIMKENDDADNLQNQTPKTSKKFTVGSFVVLKADFTVEENPILWKIDEDNLLQKIIPFKQDGKILYKTTTHFLGYNSKNANQYYPAPVSIIQKGPKEIIQFFKDKIMKDIVSEKLTMKSLCGSDVEENDDEENDGEEDGQSDNEQDGVEEEGQSANEQDGEEEEGQSNNEQDGEGDSEDENDEDGEGDDEDGEGDGEEDGEGDDEEDGEGDDEEDGEGDDEEDGEGENEEVDDDYEEDGEDYEEDGEDWEESNEDIEDEEYLD